VPGTDGIRNFLSKTGRFVLWLAGRPSVRKAGPGKPTELQQESIHRVDNATS
jgi:hypothetical protein